MQSSRSRICLVAVDVRSAHNIGAFFRTCDGFGAELFIVGASPRPSHAEDERLPHVVQGAEKSIAKTAIGAESTVKWRYARELDSCFTQLRKEGFLIFAVEQDATSQPLSSMPRAGDIALVVGREVEGLSAVEIEKCDSAYEIPMLGQKESFNVSVAGAIALYELARDTGR